MKFKMELKSKNEDYSKDFNNENYRLCLIWRNGYDWNFKILLLPKKEFVKQLFVSDYFCTKKECIENMQFWFYKNIIDPVKNK